jgi:hypothetical protein
VLLAGDIDMNPIEPRVEVDAQSDVRPEPGHAVGTGVGALLGGAAAGAAVGTVAGPVGTAIGATAGAILGGLAGRSIAAAIDPAAEDMYWRENYRHRPYALSNASYDDYGPAYRYGVDSFAMYPSCSFDDVEPALSRDWDTSRGSSNLDWEVAKHATRDAWERLRDKIERAVPGDADRDGK